MYNSLYQKFFRPLKKTKPKCYLSRLLCLSKKFKWYFVDFSCAIIIFTLSTARRWRQPDKTFYLVLTIQNDAFQWTNRFWTKVFWLATKDENALFDVDSFTSVETVFMVFVLISMVKVIILRNGYMSAVRYDGIMYEVLSIMRNSFVCTQYYL